MNKKLLAVAIASAITAPLAAQADEGNVTLYGSANVAVEYLDNGNDTDIAVSTNQSVLGVKGWEPLGNGLKAVFLFDSLLNLDTGSQLFDGGRDGWAGLAGGFGTVALGFQGRPWKTSTNNLDLFGSTIADYSSILGNVNGISFFDTGCGNAIIYFGPNINGLSGHAQYCFGETNIAPFGSTTPGFDHTDQWGAQINYGNGPLYVTYSHDDIGQTVIAAADSLTADKVGASFTLGDTFGGGFLAGVTLTGIYEVLDSNVDALSRDAFYVGLSTKLGNNTLKFAFADALDTNAVDQSGATYYAVGLSHNFSKRTELYGLYARVNNDDNSVYGLGGINTGILTSTGANLIGQAADFGENVQSVAIGVKHNF